MSAIGGESGPGGSRFNVELSGGAGPIAGFITADGAAPVPFSGWIQLADLIETHRLSLSAPASSDVPDNRDLQSNRKDTSDE